MWNNEIRHRQSISTFQHPNIFSDHNPINLKMASQIAVVVKNPPANAGDERGTGSLPGLGRSPAEGNSKPLQYSCLKNSMDRGSWPATVHMVVKTIWSVGFSRVRIGHN